MGYIWSIILVHFLMIFIIVSYILYKNTVFNYSSIIWGGGNLHIPPNFSFIHMKLIRRHFVFANVIIIFVYILSHIHARTHTHLGVDVLEKHVLQII